MTKKDKTYRLSGHSFSKQELITYCRQRLAESGMKDFEKEVYDFILEWFSESPDMAVKTSGSTGKPKEIRLLKKYMEASARATISFFGLNPGDTILHCLPMRYIAGKMMVVRALIGRLGLYIAEPSGKPELVPEKVSFSAMVPLQLSGLLQSIPGRQMLERIDKLIIGGAFVPESLEQRVQEVSTQIWQTYGMTETITHIALRKINGKEKSEWYQLLPGISVQLDNQNQLVINAPGIGVKGLVTCDIAEMNKKGEFKVKGRTDNVIISGGIKFQPEEIEKKISGVFPNNYFIGSLPDDELGRKLVLFIETGSGIEQKVFGIWQAIEQLLEKKEIPKEIVFVPDFQRTPTGKIDRRSSAAQV